MLSLAAIILPLLLEPPAYDGQYEECATDTDCMIVKGPCGTPMPYNLTFGKQMQDYYAQSEKADCDHYKDRKFSVRCIEKRCELQEEK